MEKAMKPQKSEFVSSFDIAARTFKALANAVYDAGGNDADLRRIEKDEELRRKLGELIASKPVPAEMPKPPEILIRTHEMEVEVNWDLTWEEAIRRGGPTTGGDWDIRKVGGLYPNPAGKSGITRERVLFVNRPGRNTSGPDALPLGKGKPPIHPRVALAIGERLPQLCRELGVPYMGVVSLTECSFGGRRRAVLVWYDGLNHDADLSRFTDGWHDGYWFGFSCE